MKIYTKTGDDGSTGLFGGQRVPKDSLRVRAYGAVDELNSAIGLASAAGDPENPEAKGAGLDARLQEIQADLFILGADLATPPGNEASYLPRVEESQVIKLEGWIDAYDDQLPALQNFILPGGTPLAAALHFARTACRRAEREVVTLGSHEAVGDPPRLYLNRLSDLLFVLGRFANHRAGRAEVEWAPRKKE